MKKKQLSFFFLVFFGFFIQVQAQDSDPYIDRPRPEEEFKYFFSRITSGGLFRGLRLDAPAAFQKDFLSQIWRPTWHSPVDKIEKRLKAEGIDLWGELYRNEKVLPLIATTPDSVRVLKVALNRAEKEDFQCLKSCRPFEELVMADWKSFNSYERQAWAKAYVMYAPLFANKTIIEFLADQYSADFKKAMAHIEFKLLNSKDFETAVRQLGWDGPIYFRGITAPAPGDASSRWILINDDLMRKMTPFDAPVLQSLEYVGVLTHELSHVFQDQVAKEGGIELTVKSAEGILLVEGEAEYLAEEAMLTASQHLNQASALELFVRQQADEIVNRSGQAQQGNLFPYTVGLPFVSSLFRLSNSVEKKSQVQKEIFLMIDEKQTLQEMLFKLF